MLDVLWYVEQVAAEHIKRPVQAMPSAVNPKWSESYGLLVSDIITTFFKDCAISCVINHDNFSASAEAL